MNEKIVFTFPTYPPIFIFNDFIGAEAREKNIDFLLPYKDGKNKITKIIKKILFSYKINKIIKMPLKRIFYNIENYNWESDLEYRFIITTEALAYYSIDYLLKFKKKHPNVLLYVLCTDSLSAHSVHLLFVREKLFSDIWTMVLTYDKYDAEKYNFKWVGYNIYSNIKTTLKDASTSDIYYVGRIKANDGRKIILSKVFNFLSSNGISCRFDIVDRSKKNTSSGYNILRHDISYEVVLSRIETTNVILEILQDGQETQTARWFEAISHNKKLLSNNKHIAELPYYNSRYMRYFEKLEDIDIEWIKEKVDIDYGYKNEFSPLNIIDIIRS